MFTLIPGCTSYRIGSGCRTRGLREQSPRALQRHRIVFAIGAKLR